MTEDTKIILALIGMVSLLFIWLLVADLVRESNYQHCVQEMSRPHYSAADLRLMCKRR